jgi:hypothetical protein
MTRLIKCEIGPGIVDDKLEELNQTIKLAIPEHLYNILANTEGPVSRTYHDGQPVRVHAIPENEAQQGRYDDLMLYVNQWLEAPEDGPRFILRLVAAYARHEKVPATEVSTVQQLLNYLQGKVDPNVRKRLVEATPGEP